MQTSASSNLFDRVSNALVDIRIFVKEDGGDLELLEIMRDEEED